jgi:predicted nucleic acid-binding protein
MIVIADTSPLNYLIRLGQSDLLRNIYGRVLVPRAVLIELKHPRPLPRDALGHLRPPAWLEETQPQQLDTSLSLELGAGEREAISLALEVRADLLLIDERAGRKEAEARHIAVAGTLAVLLQASKQGYIDFSEAMKELHRYGFRTSRPIEAVVMARYEQN